MSSPLLPISCMPAGKSLLLNPAGTANAGKPCNEAGMTTLIHS